MVAQNNRIPWIFVTNRFGCLVWLQDSLKAVLVLWCCSANGRNSPQVCPKTQPDAGSNACMAVGRAVDLTVLKGYDELINELEEMFEIKGQLYPRNQWEIVFTDDEGDMMLMGDDPWQYVITTLPSFSMSK
ncbi:hypothetical protein L2E82_47862 [Cichorium intybus]|uniref:Uncharacterized protein n=1 Tax=Cichorium intybus TaxID=13427 RepID=A0ACB8YX70_CICIN|nr:hypothetical protein L2E82_47862 [Cichorium intybus]